MAVTTASSRFRTSPMLLLLSFFCLSSLQLSTAAPLPDRGTWKFGATACADNTGPDGEQSALRVWNVTDNLALVRDDAVGFNCSECELGDVDVCFNDTDEPRGRLVAQYATNLLQIQ